MDLAPSLLDKTRGKGGSPCAATRVCLLGKTPRQRIKSASGRPVELNSNAMSKLLAVADGKFLLAAEFQ